MCSGMGMERMTVFYYNMMRLFCFTYCCHQSINQSPRLHHQPLCLQALQKINRQAVQPSSPLFPPAKGWGEGRVYPNKNLDKNPNYKGVRWREGVWPITIFYSLSWMMVWTFLVCMNGAVWFELSEWLPFTSAVEDMRHLDAQQF